MSNPEPRLFDQQIPADPSAEPEREAPERPISVEEQMRIARERRQRILAANPRDPAGGVPDAAGWRGANPTIPPWPDHAPAHRREGAVPPFNEVSLPTPEELMGEDRGTRFEFEDEHRMSPVLKYGSLTALVVLGLYFLGVALQAFPPPLYILTH